ncbi:choice-of-anchor M domain-containing protein [Kineosporia sp. J2-2]|uniref:Choice-of-anchor M domain-containing protein n=1 Tax=Kineosporia corallincola TaxID=2835133 RepID=A0ABS5TT76_9ACTN|nr:choice-of-anchor M domain-containing protein [Kineosporia corallincola]MBT0774027.1 choice-of-anchor M domain-containing protein [Kineosporia corallincola]
MSRRTARQRLAARTGLCALLVACLLGAGPAALAAGRGGTDDPQLEQHLDELAVVDGERVLDSGHVDLGPKFDDGRWSLLVHDDVAQADGGATSVWRHPDQTVFSVSDAARMAMPEDDAYSFLGSAPGQDVYVVPQTQNPGVVWLGWNTQDPEVMERIDRGVTLSLTGVQGPGKLSVYLQSGSFGAPDVLWRSDTAQAQPFWVDVNTHTHANWVFTEPGVYLLGLRASAELTDGSSVSDTQYLRFAVGSSASTDDALTETWTGPAEESAEDAASAPDPDPDSGQDPLTDKGFLLLAGLVAGTALLAVATLVLTVRGGRARRRALEAPGEDGQP